MIESAMLDRLTSFTVSKLFRGYSFSRRPKSAFKSWVMLHSFLSFKVCPTKENAKGITVATVKNFTFLFENWNHFFLIGFESSVFFLFLFNQFRFLLTCRSTDLPLLWNSSTMLVCFSLIDDMWSQSKMVHKNGFMKWRWRWVHNVWNLLFEF